MQLIHQLTSNLHLACQACRGAFAHGGKDAAGWAILVMLCIIIPMLATVAFFVVRIARREKSLADHQYDDPFLTTHNLNK